MTDAPQSRFSWARVLIASGIVVALVTLTVVCGPVLQMMWERYTTIGSQRAYPELSLPRKRAVVLTAESYGPWAAWTAPNGTISVRNSVRHSWPADSYRRLMLHEYGHALLDDVVADGVYWSLLRVRMYERVSATSRSGSMPEGMPEAVGVVFSAYRQAPDMVYESAYGKGSMASHFTDSFGEFFAESFARWRSGDPIDPAVARAFEDLTR